MPTESELHFGSFSLGNLFKHSPDLFQHLEHTDQNLSQVALMEKRTRNFRSQERRQRPARKVFFFFRKFRAVIGIVLILQPVSYIKLHFLQRYKCEWKYFQSVENF